MNDSIKMVRVQGWRIQTPIDGCIEAFDGPGEGQYVIYVDGRKVVEIGFYHDDLLRISASEGYVVQQIISEKFISVIEAARSI